MDKEVTVIGAGGHAKVIISTLKVLGFEVRMVLDEDENKWNKTISGIPISGPLDLIKSGNFEQGIIAIGDNKARKIIAERYNGYCNG